LEKLVDVKGKKVDEYIRAGREAPALSSAPSFEEESHHWHDRWQCNYTETKFVTYQSSL
jgi:hypothetical protein